MKTLFTILAFLASLGTAHADALTAKEWIKTCEGKIAGQLAGQLFCVSYARGLADGLALWVRVDEEHAPVCIPDAVTGGQLVEVGRKFFKDSPKDQHFAANVFLGFAFLDAWPCEGMVRKGTHQ